MKMKILITSIATLVLCLALIVGSTMAIFTSTATINVAVTAGDLAVTAEIDSAVEVRSDLFKEVDDLTGYAVGNTFANTGTATIDDEGKLQIERMTPGDAVKFDIVVTNSSNVALQYRVHAISEIGKDENGDPVEKDLTPALQIVVVVNGTSYTVDGTERVTSWINVPAVDGVGASITNMTVYVCFPNGTAANDNQYKNAAAAISFTVEAVQSNAVENGDLIVSY